MNRFCADGNLALKDEKYWSKSCSPVRIEGIRWPAYKPKKSVTPRKSQLASQPQDSTDYVYLIRMGRTKLYKIGKSNDPHGRLASMQTASPYKLKIVHTFKADNATAAEESLHHKLHEFRKEGEWFNLSDEQRSAIASVTAYEEGHFIVGGQKKSIEALFSE
jgi:hypothetical protein